jgi:hypothetical protein
LPVLGSVSAGSRGFLYDRASRSELWTPQEAQQYDRPGLTRTHHSYLCGHSSTEAHFAIDNSSPMRAIRASRVKPSTFITANQWSVIVKTRFDDSAHFQCFRNRLGGEQQQQGFVNHGGARRSRYSRFKCFLSHGGLSSAYLAIPCHSRHWARQG